MVQRVTYRRRHGYNTKSNKIKLVKTPGGRLSVHYRTKVANGPRCGDCGISLAGIPHLRPTAYARLSRRQKTVTRSYGGAICGNCVRKRIVRAFLIEEQKIVKKVLKQQQQQQKQQQKEEKVSDKKEKTLKGEKAAPAKGASSKGKPAGAGAKGSKGKIKK